MHRLFRSALLISLVACGSSGGGGQSDGNNTTPDSPPIQGDKYSVTWGPVTVPHGQESTQCVRFKLSNAGEIKVHQIHNVLSQASHHLIVYRDDDPMEQTEATTPYTCQPFTGALNTNGMDFPVVITQKHDDLVTLPDGVAYTLKPNQMIKVEMHFVNSTDNDLMANATVDLYGADPATIHDEANILFIGTPDISLPAGSTMDIHQFITMPSTLDLSASHVFAITGHTHKLGTNVVVNVAPSKTGPMTSVYAPSPFLWSEPETTTHNPPFSVPLNGGFDFTCSYHNTTDATVTFGEKTTNEMCFFWAYYYPSQGSKVCIHTQQGGGNGIDVCCPGSNLCSLVHF